MFVRNGREYEPVEAVKHIQTKYQYYKDEIATAEQFIELCATRSTMTNQPYEIRCPGRQPTPSNDWLTAELERLRQQRTVMTSDTPPDSQ